ncbi:MAG TPA: Rieske 2Fe-2S domain-containing protein [Candidatus Limnocylindria bacterium]|nr:Rieske 2Fe-2S domain-containing protein [Candidatus Limnocylindria bacterium]
MKVGVVDEMLPGSSRKFEHAGRAILIVSLAGTFAAIDSVCPHQKGDLSAGAIEDATVTCPKHGSRFDLRTGRNLRGAKILFLTVPVKDVRTFAVKVEGPDLLVEIP